MVELNPTNLVGFLAAGVGMFAYLPQVIRLWKLKSAGDVSLLSLWLLITGTSSWLVYGFLRGSLPLIIVNIVIVSCQASLLYLKIRYK